MQAFSRAALRLPDDTVLRLDQNTTTRWAQPQNQDRSLLDVIRGVIHVISRDPTRHALRSAGSIGVLGLLFGDFAGGAAVLFLTERLISAQYSQKAEIGADTFAHGVLEQAGINPGALGDMFENMRAKTDLSSRIYLYKTKKSRNFRDFLFIS